MIKCIICGEKINFNERAYLLKQGEFEEPYYKDKMPRFKGKGGGPRMYMHRSCITRMQWEKEYPKLELESIYYNYLRKGIHKGELTWKFNDIVLKDFTQEEIDNLLPKLAKKLLKNK